MIYTFHKIALTPSSGSASGSIPVSAHGLLRQVLVSPATASTTYDIKLTDRDSFDIFVREGEVGDVAEVVQIPLMGTVTVALANASVDELFDLKFVYET